MSHQGAPVLDDDQIEALSPQERAELIRRLGRPVSESARVGPRQLARIRRVRLAVMTAAAIGLVPWTVHLAFALPAHYEAHRWKATWVGFDVLLVAMIAATVVLGWFRRQLVVLTSFATGILLVCDAWFDVMTAAPADLDASIASALLAELPMALVLVAGALEIVRLSAARLWLLEPGRTVLSVKALPLEEMLHPRGG